MTVSRDIPPVPPSLSPLVPSTRFLLIAWVTFGIMMLLLLGHRPVSRAQEARVLETSRQMLEADAHGWIVPSLNGETRLRKPPLAYWYTAISYKLFGVGETTGRLPTMLIGWLAVGVTFLLGRDIAGNLVPTARDIQRGFFAAAALATGYFFIRFTRSAETDPPTLLGTVVAAWAILRSLNGSKHWLHLAAVGIAFSAMTKGPPAIYPVVFLIMLSIARRSITPIVRFITSGAIVTAIVLSCAWWLYVLSDPAGKQVTHELTVIATGANHRGLFYEYVPALMIALMPWTPFYLAGFLVGILHWKSDATFRTIVYAIMSVYLPLAITPQVQPHYLLPMLPFCGVLVGWILVRILASDLPASQMNWMRFVFGGTLIAALVAGPIALASGYAVNRTVGVLDVAAMLSLMSAALLILVVFRRRSAGLQLAAWASALLITMPIVGGWWAPTINRSESRDLARQVEYLFAGRPMMTFGADSNVTLGFKLKQTIPRTSSLLVLRDFVNRNPSAVIIIERDKRAVSATPLPDLLEMSFSESDENGVLEFFTRIGEPMTASPAK